ncbi:MAG: 4-(cytidine 5'-diphospho)-2-C-methyl-D-erythritol kinase [Paludibacteraceae bacterium]|nr:4-(cytidine 5'-diphospho)-2-C-methyl-D-erythritol kinase [Paludibacteraceae bacterium]
MLFFPNAKINIGLNIIEKRKDGFHNLETVFYPIQLTDSLEFTPSSDSQVKFTSTGFKIDGEQKNNLCLRAYNILKSKFDLPPLNIHLHKTIPLGAGLGGGSADAAFMLKALNEHFGLNITSKEISEYAAQLGSDCAFFVINKPSFAQGRGEILTEISIDIKNYKIIVIKPPLNIGTKEAFENIKPQKSEYPLLNAITCPVNEWKKIIKNDFEKNIFKNHPEIEKIKNQMYENGAVYASMSGSGSAVYGFFEDKSTKIKPQNNQYFYWEGLL